MKTLKVAVIATLVALCVATNYALVGVPNMKAMDFIVFIGGFYFGPIAGALVGGLSWTVYGAINPYGFDPRIWLATIFLESIYGVVGGLLGKNFASTDFDGQRLKLSFLFGIIGFMLTLIYEIAVNVVWAFAYYEGAIVTAIVMAAPFTVSHEVSNVAIFTLGSIPMLTVMEKILRVKRVGVSAK